MKKFLFILGVSIALAAAAVPNRQPASNSPKAKDQKTDSKTSKSYGSPMQSVPSRGQTTQNQSGGSRGQNNGQSGGSRGQNAGQSGDGQSSGQGTSGGQSLGLPWTQRGNQDQGVETTTQRRNCQEMTGRGSPGQSPEEIYAFNTCFHSCQANSTTQEYNPVCGSDGRTYCNRQKLPCANRCGRSVTFVQMGYCPQ